jgi:hypothetical protein
LSGSDTGTGKDDHDQRQEKIRKISSDDPKGAASEKEKVLPQIK